MTERGRAIDRDFASAVRDGRRTEAWAQMLSTLAPDLRPPALVRVFAVVMDRLFTDRSRPDFVSNLIVETDAEDFDAREILPDVRVPVLLIGGDEGPFFSREILEETARLIPDCTLQLHEGKGDAGAVSSMQLPRDVLAWVDGRSRVREGRAAEPPTTTNRGRDPRPHPRPQRLLHHRSDKGFDIFFRLEPDGDATHLIVDCDYQLPGHLPGVVKDLLGRSVIERTMCETGEKFRALAEATVPVPA